VAIKRQNRTIIPLGSDMVLANDIVYFITTPEYLNLVKNEAGKEDFPIKNIMVMGGSRIAQKTIQNLSSNVNVKILERDKEKSYDLAEKLGNAMIINCDVVILNSKEEGIQEMMHLCCYGQF
jgi:trk system potassium uptake protein TrkA